MAGSDRGNPTWRFPPRNGGIDFVTDPSSAHFSDAPITKLVREILQNSLDAKDTGFRTPVAVEFTETNIGRGEIGGDKLEQHIAACFDRSAKEGRARAMATYKRALDICRQKAIRCLRAQDLGTVGLDDTRWNALVVQEGAVSKVGPAPSGSYGIGKNAALNVSDLQTVFYSTRFISGRWGRVEKMQGKATLMGHNSPGDDDEQLQHIGFYTEPDGTPIMGRAIPPSFRLAETGTGVFILGFNPRSSNWVGEMTRAVIENFFHAVCGKHLVVKITAIKGKRTVAIDHETIDSLFHNEDIGGSSAAHYYRAIRDVDFERTTRIAPLGSLMVHAVFLEGAPRRTALVNRNGMLISDSKDLRINPLSPRARGLWPDFAAVVIPETDKGDLWVRSLENPSHDSLSTEHLPTEKERRDADKLFKRVRSEITGIIENLAGVDDYGEESNIDELTGLLPDMGQGADRALLAIELTPTTAGTSAEWIDADVTGDETEEGVRDWTLADLEGQSDESGPEKENDIDGESDAKPGPSESGGREGQRSAKRRRLANIRVIPISETEAVLAFDSHEEFRGALSISLTPVGVDRDARHNERLRVLEAHPITGIEGPMIVEDGDITFTPAANGRIGIRVIVDGNIQQTALRMT